MICAYFIIIKPSTLIFSTLIFFIVLIKNKKESKWNDNYYLNSNFVLTNHKGNPIQLRRFYIFLRTTVKDEEIIKEVSSQILSRSHIFKKCYRTNR